MAGDNEADEALKAFEKAYEDYEKAYKEALVTNGTKAFIQGDLKAQKALDLKLKFNLVNKEALKYIKEYKKELARGGSTIQGEFIPWLEDKSKEERAAISKILEEGYKAGKATGVKELKKGGYPKNTIAADLQQYFNSRKSHAALVARTEIARIQSHGSINRYHKQGIKKIMWLVFNPCPICQNYARRVYDIDKMPREIPAHPNCRCAAAPVADDVPTGPGPNQKVPEVFERNAKALPPVQPKDWEVKTVKTGNKNVAEYGPNYHNHWTNRRTREDHGEYTKAEEEAADYYIGSGYVDFNNYLRFPDKTNFEYYQSYDLQGKPEELKKLLDRLKIHMDSAIEKSRIPEDVTSYRSTGRHFAKELMEQGKATEKGYSSTATTFEKANRFGKRDDSGYKNILVMTNKADKPGYYVSTQEDEIIKPRGTKYKLLGIEEVDNVNYGSDYYGRVRFLYVKILE